MKNIITRCGGWRGVVRGLLEGLILLAWLGAAYFVLMVLAAVMVGVMVR